MMSIGRYGIDEYKKLMYTALIICTYLLCALSVYNTLCIAIDVNPQHKDFYLIFNFAMIIDIWTILCISQCVVHCALYIVSLRWTIKMLSVKGNAGKPSLFSSYRQNTYCDI